MLAKSELLKKQKSKEKFENPFAKLEVKEIKEDIVISKSKVEIKTEIIKPPDPPYRPSGPTSDGGIRP